MGVERFLGEIQLWPLVVAPPNWAACDGRLLSIPQYQALYSLLGTKFGGDGVSSFALPDLRGRTPAGAAFGANEPMPIGAQRGSPAVSLDATNLPAHSHDLMASSAPATSASIVGAIPAATAASDPPIYAPYVPDVTLDPACIQSTGYAAPHNNMQPSLGLNFIIALAGLYPDRP